MARKRYSIIEKMSTVWKLRDMDIKKASEITGVSTRLIRKWEKDYDRIKAEYYKYLHDEGVHKLMVAQNRFGDKIIMLTEEVTEAKVKNAPLNQVVGAIGTLVDRFIRIHNAKDIRQPANHHRHVIEYYDATTGKTSETPPWTEDDSIDQSALHDSYLWQTLWENRIGEAGHNGTGGKGENGVVARTHVSDGGSSLARPEIDDEERAWHPD